MSDFRTSKGTGTSGARVVVRKGSKYDKDSKRYADKSVGIIDDPKNRESHGDDMMGIDLKVAAKRGTNKKLGRTSNDTYEYLATGDKPRKKESSGRKDHPFFKHSTKGK